MSTHCRLKNISFKQQGSGLSISNWVICTILNIPFCFFNNLLVVFFLPDDFQEQWFFYRHLADQISVLGIYMERLDWTIRLSLRDGFGAIFENLRIRLYHAFSWNCYFGDGYTADINWIHIGYRHHWWFSGILIFQRITYQFQEMKWDFLPLWFEKRAFLSKYYQFFAILQLILDLRNTKYNNICNRTINMFIFEVIHVMLMDCQFIFLIIRNGKKVILKNMWHFPKHDSTLAGPTTAASSHSISCPGCKFSLATHPFPLFWIEEISINFMMLFSGHWNLQIWHSVLGLMPMC